MSDWDYTFSFEDYRAGRLSGKYQPPSALRPLYEGKPTRKATEFDVKPVFQQLRRRLGPEYFGKVKKFQTDTLDYAAQTFPEYRLLIEDILADDWMAMMDWRGFGRDHVVHQPLSAYVATCLLGGSRTGVSFRFNGINLVEHIYNQVIKSSSCEYLRHQICAYGAPAKILNEGTRSRLLWSGMIEVSAYVATLFHDCGYPWAFKERVGKALDTLVTTLIGEGCGESLRKSHNNRLMIAPFMGYKSTSTKLNKNQKKNVTDLISQAIEKTHGAPGAVALLEMNARGGAGNMLLRNPIKLFCVEWAALATLMHDMSGVYWGNKKDAGGNPDNSQLRLKFDVDPLSCIVTLCDIIQEFGRYQADFTGITSGSQTVPKVNYEFPCKGTRIEWNEGKKELSIVYLYKNRKDMALKKCFLAKELKNICDPVHGFLDLSALGVNQIYLRAEMK